MLRAGPFSDERVVRLANRRFIPFFFDLSDRGAAGDPDARQFVVAQRKRLGGQSVSPPDLLFMTAKGEILAEVSNFASEDAVLKVMREVLDKHPQFAKPTEAEQALTGVAKAEFCIDLIDYKGAIAALSDLDTDRANYLRGRIHRLQGDGQAAEASLAKVSDSELADDVCMERAHLQWQQGNFEELAQRLDDFPSASNRYSEARYYLGLAEYHTGEQDEARIIWKAAIKKLPQDRWIYRCDWAYCARSQGSRRATFSSSAKRTSPLNRIGYMGRRNPDLARR